MTNYGPCLMAVTLTLTGFATTTIGVMYGPAAAISYLGGVIVGLVLSHFFNSGIELQGDKLRWRNQS
jgi:hypothetical protein